jgi:hypothetical protein
VLKQREKYISEHASTRIGGSTKLRKTPPINQRLAHRLKGPQIGENRLNLPPTTLYLLGDPPGSVPDERRRERWRPWVGQPQGHPNLDGLLSRSVLAERSPTLSPRRFTRFPCIIPPETDLGGLYKEEESLPFKTHNKRREELHSKVKPYLRSA